MTLEKSVLLSGYYGFDNSGDDAILKAIIKDIREENPKLDIVVLSNNPKKTEKMYSVKAINRFKFGELIKGVRNTSLLISGGGSLLQDITSTRSLLYYLAVMTLAKLFRKPVMVYANGIGPISKKGNRLLTRMVLNHVNLITLRDDDSKSYLEKMKIKNKNIVVTADPVFTLDVSPKNVIENIFAKEGIPSDKKFIGISIRPWKKADNLVEVISKVIDYITEKYDVNIILIPMHYPEDLDISNKVLANVDKASCFVIKDQYAVEDIMGIIKELDMIVAMRLHSLIYAATQEIPMVGLVYDPKVEGILYSLGMNHMSNVENLDYEQLISNIDYVWNNKNELKNILNRGDEELKSRALSNVTMAMELLKVGD